MVVCFRNIIDNFGMHIIQADLRYGDTPSLWKVYEASQKECPQIRGDKKIMALATILMIDVLN
jgi:hypothetical protein